MRAGDLRDEAAAVRAVTGGGVLLAAEPLHVAGLAVLRSLGLLRTPLVVVFHQVAPVTPWWRRVVAGCDVIVCLSQAVRSQLLRDHSRSPDDVRWGPSGGRIWSRPSHDRRGRPGDLVVSAGKTERDTESVVEALRQTGLPVSVYGARPAGLPRGVLPLHAAAPPPATSQARTS